MRIQDLENRTGLERPTIRFYEREGLLIPNRLENGYRDYSETDVALLMKIKLLRQLGMSIEMIKQLQQGSADFAEVLMEQIGTLSSQIDAHKRARAVCLTIQLDGAPYQTLDAEHYLKLLREIRIDDRTLGRTNFQEDIPEEIHPWRRFAARSLDMSLFAALLQFLIFVVFRARPIPDEFGLTLIGIGFGFLYIPLEALLLHKFGTTPGKWAMGIRLEWIQGGNLPYLEAIYRSWRVWKSGMGFGIPVAEIVMNVACYCKLTGRALSRWRKYNEIDPPTEMDWDDDTEIIYSQWEGKRWLRLVLIATVWALLAGISVADMVKPKYRGEDLTVSQFAANYNTTLQFMNPYYTTWDTLQPDGSKYPMSESDHSVVIHIGAEPEFEQMNFHYETVDGYVRSVRCQNSWTEVRYLSPLSNECYQAAVSVLLAQDGCGILEIQEFTELWESELKNSTTSFSYRNLEIQWEILLENCTYHSGTVYSTDHEPQPTVQMTFEILIHHES